MTSGGNVDINSWVDDVPTLIEAWYPGEQGGNALAEILFGDVNPSGKLPVGHSSQQIDLRGTLKIGSPIAY